MKSKIGITVFSNGDMDILQASLWEDLWNDYVFYRKKSHHQSEKGTKKGEFLARRYERAACLTLYEWFDAIVSRWIWGDIRTSCTRRGTAAAQVPATTHVDKKGRRVLASLWTPPTGGCESSSVTGNDQ